MLKAKIHRASVTMCNLNYEGSISIDENLIIAAGLNEYEKVLVVDLNNGARFETYIIKAEKGSCEIGLNGAAARLVEIDDKIIIIAFALYNEEELKSHKPKIIFVDEKNNIINK